ncbi:sulfatase-like hydrolase/transferase [Stieleria sp. TO1_6]|uniref:sulfatase-like hydrolase/transferase n=1 Tax=Stieleria tagensis TaxID=2956795 RepID=UPI00209B7B58|nr:sulfatase-like hydrolase/transferase [Stieleria tagensis]MCO8120527.1 sulfatase-like hydrolase/transferase [Stieleria tagensis]
MIQFLAESTRVAAFKGCRRPFPRRLQHRVSTFAFLTLAALFAQSLSMTSANAESAARPNVVLILTDDQGWGDLGVHDNPIIATPTLDRLAAESVQLQRFYVSPVCAPTRAALLTGRYPERCGVSGVTGRREVMRSSETTIAELFHDAGYATGCFGKWHNGQQMPLHPNGQGFDEFFGFCGGHFNLYDNPLLERNGRPVQTSGYITDLLTDAAIEFIQTPREQPFLCYVPYNAPHGPFQIRQDLFDKYNTGEIPEKTAAVYAMVENIDTNVDRILDSLDQLGQSDNTIVLFLTDNGPNGKRFNGGMRGIKGSVHEGGCRVPCFVRWPGKLTPKTVSPLTAHIDLLPTLAEFCGITVPDRLELDGRSLVTLMQNGSDASLDHRHLLTYRPNQLHLEKFGKAAVRTDRFRLTIEQGKPALFDLSVDPEQTTDIAEQQPQVMQRLQDEIRQYVKTIGPSITATAFVPIGQQRPTFIPAVDAMLQGNPQFADGISWAHSWIDNWSAPADQISWPVNFEHAGRYQISLHSVCDSNDATVSVTVAGQTAQTDIQRYASKATVRPDLDSEATPRRMQTFREQPLGIIEVDQGQTTIALTRLDNSGAKMEVGGITIASADIPDKSQFHLFLLAGQSNMAGRGKPIPADKLPDTGILMLDRSGTWVPAVDPLHFDKSVAGVGLGRQFARRYAQAHPGVTVGLVPCAAGGSPIASWTPGGFHNQTKSHPYDDAMRRIEIASQSGVFHGILWHQGESDSKPNLAPEYKTALAQLMERFREVLGQTTPIMIGGLAQKNRQDWSESRVLVDQAQRELADELPACEFVESNDLTLNRDNVHFDRESLMEFGRRYADALARIESNAQADAATSAD